MIAIRPATSAEAQDLAEIGLAAWEKAIRVWGEDADRLRENAKEAYYDFCTRCWPDILVAEWDGDLAGWGSCEKADDFITDLWVLPEFQGRGIGTALLEQIEAGIIERARHPCPQSRCNPALQATGLPGDNLFRHLFRISG